MTDTRRPAPSLRVSAHQFLLEAVTASQRFKFRLFLCGFHGMVTSYALRYHPDLRSVVVQPRVDEDLLPHSVQFPCARCHAALRGLDNVTHLMASYSIWKVPSCQMPFWFNLIVKNNGLLVPQERNP